METFSTKRTSAFKIITIILLVASLSLGAYINTSKDVKITIDFETEEVKTYARTVEELLKEEDINLKEGSYINFPLDTKIEDDMEIEIKTPKTYILKIGKERTEVKSVFVKLGDILKDIDVELGEMDYTSPKLDAELEYGTEIEIFRVEEKIEEVEKVIPFKEKVEKSNKLEQGKKKVVQEGKDGLKKLKVKRVYENGNLVSEEILDENIIEKPVNKVIHKGTKKKAPKRASRGSTAPKGSLNSASTIVMNATAYDDSAQSQGKWVGTTAIGVKPRVGIVAVDPRVIPLGTRLYVESLDGSKDYGYCIAGDTGGAIKGKRIDLFFNTRAEVRSFGRRQVKVHILK